MTTTQTPPGPDTTDDLCVMCGDPITDNPAHPFSPHYGCAAELRALTGPAR